MPSANDNCESAPGTEEWNQQQGSSLSDRPPGQSPQSSPYPSPLLQPISIGPPASQDHQGTQDSHKQFEHHPSPDAKGQPMPPMGAAHEMMLGTGQDREPWQASQNHWDPRMQGMVQPLGYAPERMPAQGQDHWQETWNHWNPSSAGMGAPHGYAPEGMYSQDAGHEAWRGPNKQRESREPGIGSPYGFAPQSRPDAGRDYSPRQESRQQWEYSSSGSGRSTDSKPENTYNKAREFHSRQETNPQWDYQNSPGSAPIQFVPEKMQGKGRDFQLRQESRPSWDYSSSPGRGGSIEFTPEKIQGKGRDLQRRQEPSNQREFQSTPASGSKTEFAAEKPPGQGQEGSSRKDRKSRWDRPSSPPATGPPAPTPKKGTSLLGTPPLTLSSGLIAPEQPPPSLLLNPSGNQGQVFSTSPPGPTGTHPNFPTQQPPAPRQPAFYQYATTASVDHYNPYGFYNNPESFYNSQESHHASFDPREVQSTQERYGTQETHHSSNQENSRYKPNNFYNDEAQYPEDSQRTRSSKEEKSLEMGEIPSRSSSSSRPGKPTDRPGRSRDRAPQSKSGRQMDMDGRSGSSSNFRSDRPMDRDGRSSNSLPYSRRDRSLDRDGRPYGSVGMDRERDGRASANMPLVPPERGMDREGKASGNMPYAPHERWVDRDNRASGNMSKAPSERMDRDERVPGNMPIAPQERRMERDDRLPGNMSTERAMDRDGRSMSSPQFPKTGKPMEQGSKSPNIAPKIKAKPIEDVEMDILDGWDSTIAPVDKPMDAEGRPPHPTDSWTPNSRTPPIPGQHMEFDKWPHQQPPPGHHTHGVADYRMHGHHYPPAPGGPAYPPPYNQGPGHPPFYGAPGAPPPPRGPPPPHYPHAYPSGPGFYPPPPTGAPPPMYPQPPPPAGVGPSGQVAPQFSNDGNFMEIARKKMEEEKKRKSEEDELKNKTYQESTPPKKKSRWGPRGESEERVPSTRREPREPPSQQASTPGSAEKGGDSKSWPESLNRYVELAFARCSTDEDRFIVQKELKTIISDSITRNKLWNTNWSEKQLPRLAGEDEFIKLDPPDHRGGPNRFQDNRDSDRGRGRGRGRGGRGRDDRGERSQRDNFGSQRDRDDHARSRQSPSRHHQGQGGQHEMEEGEEVHDKERFSGEPGHSREGSGWQHQQSPFQSPGGRSGGRGAGRGRGGRDAGNYGPETPGKHGSDADANSHHAPEAPKETIGPHGLPLKPGVGDCHNYRNTGMCRRGINCQYNHPLEPEEVTLGTHGYPLRPGQNDCFNFRNTGACRAGKACRFNHPEESEGQGKQGQGGRGGRQQSSEQQGDKDNSSKGPTQQGTNADQGKDANKSEGYETTILTFGTHGLPIYPEAKICRNFRDTGECKWAKNCQYNHPEDAEPGAEAQTTMTLGPHGLPLYPDKSDCKMLLEKGACRFGLNCSYNHPPEFKVKEPEEGPLGLLIRPEQSTCKSFAENGICKFGPRCFFNHPLEDQEQIAANEGGNKKTPKRGKRNQKDAAATEEDPETPAPIIAAPVTTAESKKREERGNKFKDFIIGDLPEEKPATPGSAGRRGGKATGLNPGARGQRGTVTAPLHKHVHNPKLAFQASGENDSGELDFEALTIIGTCQTLEKRYFRLTSPPEPHTVRPEPILQEWMLQLKEFWKASAKSYEYMCDQLKALRQDLVVQRIKNSFTVDVYETHARIALEEGDLNEYNQCQTQLKELYDAGATGHEMEFTAYRILYYVNMQDNKKNKDGSTEMLKMLKGLPKGAGEDTAVAHALKVRQSMANDDYYLFFKLYEAAPNMSAYIMDMMLDKIRIKAVQRIVKAYKPSIATNFVESSLAFDSTEECVQFLQVIGIQFIGDEIDCKASTVNPVAWQNFKFERDKGSLL